MSSMNFEMRYALDGLEEMYRDLERTQTAPIVLDHDHIDAPIGEITLRSCVIPHLPSGCMLAPIFRFGENGEIQLLAATLLRPPSVPQAKDKTEPEVEEPEPEPFIEEENPEDILI
jgi:hypothetical protein